MIKINDNKSRKRKIVINKIIINKKIIENNKKTSEFFFKKIKTEIIK